MSSKNIVSNEEFLDIFNKTKEKHIKLQQNMEEDEKNKKIINHQEFYLKIEKIILNPKLSERKKKTLLYQIVAEEFNFY